MRLLSLKELEERTGIKARTWRQFAKSGKIKAVRGPRKKILVFEEDLEKFLDDLPKVSN